MTHLDHITVTALALDEGIAHVRYALGVAPAGGGEHPPMGTHNALLRLGDSVYLEVIAPNPDAPRPSRPRWFGLDELAPGTPPRLGVWAARTAAIERALTVSSEPLGPAVPMTRGALQWLITIPPDGRPLLDGAAPALIQWQGAAHPAATLPDHGFRLVALELRHPEPARVEALLRSLAFEGEVHVHAGSPGLAARIETPAGSRWLA